MARPMFALRAFIKMHRNLAAALIVLAFCVKALIPAGFMVASAPDRVLTLTICSDASAAQKLVEITVPGKPAPANSHGSDGAKDAKCAFSGLGYSAIGGADPIQLALSLAAILLLGMAAVAPLSLQRRNFLQPPSHGPPAIA